MNAQAKITKTLMIVFLLAGILVTISCENRLSTGPGEENNNEINAVRNNIRVSPRDVQLTDASEYPQEASVSVKYFNSSNEYKGAKLDLENSSWFEFWAGELTPPESISWGETVVITMRADRDPQTGELIFSFGPSGCQFEPAAELWLDYSALGTDDVTLYYLDDDGNRIEHMPDKIDYRNKSMCIYIDHFSRYAVAYSN